MTNQRLVWNFEIRPAEPFPELSPPEDLNEDIRWEARFFCTSDTVVCLHGLDESFLNLARYKIKERQDSYYILPGHGYNIKKRRNEIIYKPLLHSTPECLGFGKKIVPENSHGYLPGTQNSLTGQALLQLIEKHSRKIHVEKTALIYKFGHTLKLELARLTLRDHSYFSACVEGRSRSLVTRLKQRIFPGQPLCSYVEFLNKPDHEHE